MTTDVARAVCATLDRVVAPDRPNDDIEARVAFEGIVLETIEGDAAWFEYCLGVTHAYQAHQTRVRNLPGS